MGHGVKGRKFVVPFSVFEDEISKFRPIFKCERSGHNFDRFDGSLHFKLYFGLFL